MKLSIFTTVTDPITRGDTVGEAFDCYRKLADEVITVNGNGWPFYQGDVLCEWPKEFSWEFIGEQFQRGYEACTGDVVIHADLDFIFHPRDYKRIIDLCDEMVQGDGIALTFPKYQFILPDRYLVKSRLVLAVNKALYGDRIKFNGGGDLCQPTLDGVDIPLDGYKIKDARIPIWNYECILKTKEQLMEDKGRFARAWERNFGVYKLGGPDDVSAYDKWYSMVEGRFNKPYKKVPLEEHPKVMQNTIKNLKPENFGYNGFGLIEGRVYE